MALRSKTWQQQSVPGVAGAPGLEKVEWEWGAWFSSDSRKSLVRMHMHEGGMNIRALCFLFLIYFGEGNGTPLQYFLEG